MGRPRSVRLLDGQLSDARRDIIGVGSLRITPLPAELGGDWSGESKAQKEGSEDLHYQVWAEIVRAISVDLETTFEAK